MTYLLHIAVGIILGLLLSLLLYVIYRQRQKAELSGPMFTVTAMKVGAPLMDDYASGFVQKLPRLFASLDKLLNRTVKAHNSADRILFPLCCLAYEDFREIFWLCVCGFGTGGMQILRHLYELTVTLNYLSNNPHEANTFVEYYAISQGKLLNHAKELGQVAALKLTAEVIAKIEEAYKTAKPKFEETLCEKCGTKRVRISWSRLDLFSMARQTTEALKHLYAVCYIGPTWATHASFARVVIGLREVEGGLAYIENRTQKDELKFALLYSHHLIIHVFEVMNRHYKLGLEDQLAELARDFFTAWPEARTTAASGHSAG